MRILWLKADLLLPLDKGGKLRTWHLMRHLARRHDDRVPRASPSRAHAGRGRRAGCARWRRTSRSCRAPESAEGLSGGSTRTSLRHLVAPLPYAVAKYRSRRSTRRARRDCCGAALRSRWSATSSFPAVNLPERPAVSRRPVHAQRRGGDLAAPRGDRRTGPARLLLRQQRGRMLRFEATRVRALRRAFSRCRRRTARPSRGSIRRPAATGPRRPDRGGHARTSRRRGSDGRRRPARTSSSPARWTGCPTRTPCSTSAGTSCRASARSSRARRFHRRPQPDAPAGAARPAPRASPSPAGWTTCGRTSRAPRSPSSLCASAAGRG